MPEKIHDFHIRIKGINLSEERLKEIEKVLQKGAIEVVVDSETTLDNPSGGIRLKNKVNLPEMEWPGETIIGGGRF